MPDPGAIGSQAPRGDDEVTKQIKALQDDVRQALAAAANAQALIAVANAQLALAANQVAPLVGVASAGSFTVTTTATTYLTVNLTVPAGYTKALVTATSSGSMIPNTAANDRLYSTITIASNVGTEVYGYCDNQLGGGVSAAHAVTLSGLTGGGTVSSILSMRTLLTSSGAGSARAVLTVTANFQK